MTRMTHFFEHLLPNLSPQDNDDDGQQDDDDGHQAAYEDARVAVINLMRGIES